MGLLCISLIIYPLFHFYFSVSAFAGEKSILFALPSIPSCLPKICFLPLNSFARKTITPQSRVQYPGLNGRVSEWAFLLCNGMRVFCQFRLSTGERKNRRSHLGIKCGLTDNYYPTPNRQTDRRRKEKTFYQEAKKCQSHSSSRFLFRGGQIKGRLLRSVKVGIHLHARTHKYANDRLKKIKIRG